MSLSGTRERLVRVRPLSVGQELLDEVEQCSWSTRLRQESIAATAAMSSRLYPGVQKVPPRLTIVGSSVHSSADVDRRTSPPAGASHRRRTCSELRSYRL